MQSSIFNQNMQPMLACSLSLQFILQEWMYISDLLRHLEVVTPLRLQSIDVKSEIAHLFKELEKLFLFSPTQSSNALDKLCFYCEILLQASSTNGREIEAILQEMRSSAGKLKFEMLLWKKMESFPRQICDALGSCYSLLRKKLFDFFKKLSPFFYDMRYDENVLAYLVENRKRMNAILGHRRIEELLSFLFPEGPLAFRKVIEEGYARRGFSSSFYTLEPFIDQIEWESPCNIMQT